MEALAYIGLGSNLNDPIAQIKRARQAIAALEGVSEQGFSSLYQSKPLGPQDQPDYINAVMAVSCNLSPYELLDALQAIEAAHGRVRGGERWGPRVLDLDLLLYGSYCVLSAKLLLPHPGLAKRPFVLYPLAEIAPLELLIPGQGTLEELLQRCLPQGLKRVEVEDE
jgi:2-amino-4-hydroxy-6-hydroxymethyldihydropteridine diphosphokinase